jgi:rhodanese-related sulfurtransferase/DNA-binding transcriptional ArsR family regulator
MSQHVMSRPNVKKLLFEQFARVGKALGSAHRLELLELLAQGERSVDALASVAKLPVANVSQHLQQLRRSGLVTTRKEGLRVYYRLSDPAVAQLLSALERIGESQLAEVDRLVRSYLTVRDSLEPITREDLKKRLEEGEVTVLDVRPPEEFAAGHLPGAVNIPLKELEGKLETLPHDQDIVAYCRGPYCVLAFEAVARLREHGLQARRMQDGFPEWQTDGYPVEQ